MLAPAAPGANSPDVVTFAARLDQPKLPPRDPDATKAQEDARAALRNGQLAATIDEVTPQLDALVGAGVLSGYNVLARVGVVIAAAPRAGEEAALQALLGLAGIEAVKRTTEL